MATEWIQFSLSMLTASTADAESFDVAEDEKRIFDVSEDATNDAVRYGVNCDADDGVASQTRFPSMYTLSELAGYPGRCDAAKAYRYVRPGTKLLAVSSTDPICPDPAWTNATCRPSQGAGNPRRRQ